ncbi:hypothetical protein [Streptomyces sp. Root1310]|uniref:hypothetical protein n=1 Tax=Streptomyces sp. Root1310 TaxID=1736452 RepID=UPI00070A2E4A|nr:hypothetical protein [Streptomyces sp. Root1310]KQX77150.1 hypothetical protein ASD48_37555 [Streptomyces sp. Root1310]
MAVSSMGVVVWRGLNRTAGWDAEAAAGTTVTPRPHSIPALAEGGVELAEIEHCAHFPMYSNPPRM